MTESFYETPKSQLLKQKFERVKVLNQKIKNGWVAAVTLGFLNVIMLGYSYYNDSIDFVAAIPFIIEIVLIFTLAFGIYHMSRIATTLLLVFFVTSKALTITEAAQVSGLGLLFIFSYFFFQATMASYQLHTIKHQTDQ